MAEHQPSKLRVASSSLVSRSKLSSDIEESLEGRLHAARDAHVAQSAEHFLGKEEVTGSILVMGSTPHPIEVSGREAEASCRRGNLKEIGHG